MRRNDDSINNNMSSGGSDNEKCLWTKCTTLVLNMWNLRKWHISLDFICEWLAFYNFKLQECQHPLTGQRAANFRLLANQ